MYELRPRRPQPVRYSTDSSYEDEEGSEYETPITPRSPTLSIRSKVDRPREISCPYESCGKTFRTYAYLEAHERTHTKQRPFQCQQCDASFARKENLTRHVRGVHATTLDYHCDWPGCQKSCATEQSLKRHCKRHKEVKHHCSKCNKYFLKYADFERHVETRHQVEHICLEPDLTTGVACGRRYNRTYRLNEHIEEAHRQNRFWCTVCVEGADQVEVANAFKYASFQALKCHRQEMHPHKCLTCSKIFDQANHLRIHEQTHRQTLTVRQSLHCPESNCNRTFVRQSNLTAHLRAAHGQGTRFRCGADDVDMFEDVQHWDGTGACGASFAYKQSLVNHIRTHHLGLPQRGYRRQQKRKKRSEGLFRAVEAHDQSKDGQDIACVYADCMRNFSRQRDLEQHLRLGHRLEEDEIEGVLREREALEGGEFWLAAPNEEDEDDDDGDVETLLEEQALNGGPFWIQGW